jgi:hypothetical protein
MFLTKFLKNRIYISILILTMPVIKSFAQTTIADTTITNQAIFTKAGSPYTLTGNIYIKPNGTLTVEPGVEILISPTAGKISAEGNYICLDQLRIV